MIKMNKLKLCIFLTLILLMSIIITAGNAYAWFDQSWGFRQVITIDSAQVPGDLTNFPILVSVTDPNLRVMPSGNVGKTNGGDILFTSSDAITQLDHEIENYDPSTGELVAWVEVPDVSATSDTVIFMYYGNPGASDQWDVDGTWDSNYLSVWHLNEDPSISNDCDGGAGSKEICDSTSNSYDGDSCQAWNCFPVMDSGDQVPGQIGGSLDFDGINDWIEYGTSLVIDVNFTIEAWINVRNFTAGSMDSIIGHAWDWHLQIRDSGKLIFRRWGPYQGRQSTAALSTDRWYHVVITLTPGTTDNLKIYIDGVLDTLASMQAPVKNTSVWDLRIAKVQGAPDIDWFDGFIDEVRMSETVRSPEWIEASYNNQNNPSSFLSFGAPMEFTPVPTMTQWGMIVFMLLAGFGAVYFLRKRGNA